MRSLSRGRSMLRHVPPTAGVPWIAVCNVSQPTMTVYSPKGTNTGVAVVVFPGGGYNCLAMDLEGTEICDWLTSRGITAVLLKYRVPTRSPEGVWGIAAGAGRRAEDGGPGPLSRRRVAD